MGPFINYAIQNYGGRGLYHGNGIDEWQEGDLAETSAFHCVQDPPHCKCRSDALKHIRLSVVTARTRLFPQKLQVYSVPFFILTISVFERDTAKLK